MLWVDKYKPRQPKDILGNAEGVARLTQWLREWHRRAAHSTATKVNLKDRLCFLTGPPGVGKTCSIHAVASSLGFVIHEWNASHVRSARLLASELTGAVLHAKTIGACLDPQGPLDMVVMEEVDGMSGNEDRGGLAKLLELARRTQVPIVCTANDGYHPKLKTLRTNSLHLVWRAPPLPQVVDALWRRVVLPERLNMTRADLVALVRNAQGDVRQCLTTLHMQSIARSSAMAHPLVSPPSTPKDPPVCIAKVSSLNLFELARELFQPPLPHTPWITPRTERAVDESDMMSMFVFENYTRTAHRSSPTDLRHMEQCSDAAEWMAMGDVMQARRFQTDPLPTDVATAFSCVVPASCVSPTTIQFPQGLGNMSKRTKNLRLTNELRHALADIMPYLNLADAILDILPALRRALVRPLLDQGTAGIPTVLKYAKHYHLDHDLFSTLVQLESEALSGDMSYSRAHRQTKAALTRALKALPISPALSKAGSLNPTAKGTKATTKTKRKRPTASKRPVKRPTLSKKG
jgi:replication factor C subunit 1